jgi:hypothetical protein
LTPKDAALLIAVPPQVVPNIVLNASLAPKLPPVLPLLLALLPVPVPPDPSAPAKGLAVPGVMVSDGTPGSLTYGTT